MTEPLEATASNYTANFSLDSIFVPEPAEPPLLDSSSAPPLFQQNPSYYNLIDQSLNRIKVNQTAQNSQSLEDINRQKIIDELPGRIFFNALTGGMSFVRGCTREDYAKYPLYSSCSEFFRLHHIDGFAADRLLAVPTLLGTLGSYHSYSLAIGHNLDQLTQIHSGQVQATNLYWGHLKVDNFSLASFFMARTAMTAATFGSLANFKSFSSGSWASFSALNLAGNVSSFVSAILYLLDEWNKPASERNGDQIQRSIHMLASSIPNSARFVIGMKEALEAYSKGDMDNAMHAFRGFVSNSPIIKKIFLMANSLGITLQLASVISNMTNMVWSLISTPPDPFMAHFYALGLLSALVALVAQCVFAMPVALPLAFVLLALSQIFLMEQALYMQKGGMAENPFTYNQIQKESEAYSLKVINYYRTKADQPPLTLDGLKEFWVVAGVSQDIHEAYFEKQVPSRILVKANAFIQAYCDVPSENRTPEFKKALVMDLIEAFYPSASDSQELPGPMAKAALWVLVEPILHSQSFGLESLDLSPWVFRQINEVKNSWQAQWMKEKLIHFDRSQDSMLLVFLEAQGQENPQEILAALNNWGEDFKTAGMGAALAQMESELNQIETVNETLSDEDIILQLKESLDALSEEEKAEMSALVEKILAS